MAYLEVVRGPGVGWQYRLRDDWTTIGRHPDCQVVLREVARVSRQHAQILREGEDYYIKDLDSRNGTYHNDERIDEELRLLKDRDIVRICDVELAFRCFPDELSRHLAKTVVVPDEGAALRVVLVNDHEDPIEPWQSTLSREVVTTDPVTMVRSATSLKSRMDALVEIAGSLGKVLALNEVLPTVMKSLLRIFDQADRGFIVLETEEGELEPCAQIARTPAGQKTVRISRTIVRQVMESKQAILTVDAAHDERLGQSESIAELKIRSMMCAPLIDSEGRALGVIEVDTLDEGSPFQKEDLEVLMSVASQAGIAIDNAKMHEAVLHRKEMEQELALAQEIQNSFLPQSRPEIEGYELFDYYHPAEEVGGDYFDYIPLPGDRLGIVVADVAGHGVPAAMLMARVSGEMRSHLESETEPGLAITKLNDRLTVRRFDRFVTLLACVLDPAKHEVTFVIAGHMRPIWRHASGNIEEPGKEVSKIPLGVEPETNYGQITIPLERGDWLVMYTDGISDARSPDDKRFTIERIRDHVRNAQGAEEAFQGIIRDVRRFVGEHPQEDDMCLVCLHRL
ncbi:MAG: SpoIIE family protein phosphatase [Planctomycetes bacterium]|nr:SpoIIE family protein phosphatase [Planctomycetota bacterium]